MEPRQTPSVAVRLTAACAPKNDARGSVAPDGAGGVVVDLGKEVVDAW